MDNRITENLTSELIYLYNTGKLYHAYRTFGAQIVRDEEGDILGTEFTVWVPDVQAVRTVGDFNRWENSGGAVSKDGIWTEFIAEARPGDRYKFEIITAEGERLLKCDPFAFGSEMRPDTASVITELEYEWNDGEWLDRRPSRRYAEEPMNIYEVHLGSWKRHPREDGFYSYRELAETLIPYVKEMGYNYIEILPVMEHPLDASWGYQVGSYYAASSRYGKPVDFKYFIDTCHREGVGVILDWVPGHFCPDEHYLANFNGRMLYESEIHPDWGTYKFDFSRGQVRSFLLSNAMFWLDEYHADGLRVDGVSSMLYLNFGVSDRSKLKYNKYGEEGNLEAIEFLRDFNRMVGNYMPGCFTCAEESSSWPMVTMPPEDGGLGFHFKWNMGWMNDTLEYVQTDFPSRAENHNKLTFSMTYAYSENFILPLSHDEVVHGKKSLIGRMPGDIWRQFAGLRLLAMYQMTHPGKKLSFMGNEFAQFIEWREYEELEWFMLKYENHAKIKDFIAELNRLYLSEPALWACDDDWKGFTWLDADNREQGILSYIRSSDDGQVIVVLNTGVRAFDKFRVGVPGQGKYEEIFSSDAAEFGGSDRLNRKPVKADRIPMHGQPYSIEITLPVVGGTILKLRG